MIVFGRCREDVDLMRTLATLGTVPGALTLRSVTYAKRLLGFLVVNFQKYVKNRNVKARGIVVNIIPLV